MPLAIITGASRGIGSAIHSALTRDGWDVMTASRSVGVDVTSLRSLWVLAHDAAKAYGAIDALVCCAGIAGPGAFEPVDGNEWIEWSQTIETNLLGTVNAVRAVVPHMRTAKRGHIVTFSGGGLGGPNLARERTAYVTSKAAVVAFTEAVAPELERDGIAINAIAPGNIATSMTGGLGESPTRVVNLVRWILSPACTVTGKLFSVRFANYGVIRREVQGELPP